MASTLGYLFPLFQFYWNYCRDFENQIIKIGQLLVLQSRVFEKLSQEWKQFKWDETELDWICSRIAQKDTMLDLSKFYTHPIAYIDNAKNYYFLESHI